MDSQEGKTRQGHALARGRVISSLFCVSCVVAPLRFSTPPATKFASSNLGNLHFEVGILVCLEGSGHENFSHHFAQVKPTPGTFKVDAQRGFARCSKLIYDTGDLDFQMLP